MPDNSHSRNHGNSLDAGRVVLALRGVQPARTVTWGYGRSYRATSRVGVEAWWHRLGAFQDCDADQPRNLAKSVTVCEA